MFCLLDVNIISFLLIETGREDSSLNVTGGFASKTLRQKDRKLEHAHC